MFFLGPLDRLMQMTFTYLAPLVIPALRGQRGALSSRSEEAASEITVKSLLWFKEDYFLGKFPFALKERKQDIIKKIKQLPSLQSKLHSLGKYQQYHHRFNLFLLPFLQTEAKLTLFLPCTLSSLVEDMALDMTSKKELHLDTSCL